jgi:tyrosyl-tRNA synthetase
MAMQAFDFVHLNTEHNCLLQIGGSDQWANITAGVDLGRKMSLTKGVERPQMFGLSYPLLTNSDGVKMGKTEKGALWLDAAKTSAYDFYQYLINVHDNDVEKLLTYFTNLKIDDIKSKCSADIIAAKKFMATALTELVHGSNAEITVIPTETVTVQSGANIVDILSFTSIVASKRIARELIADGAILIDGERITEPNYVPNKSTFIVKKGKKTLLKLTVVDI